MFTYSFTCPSCGCIHEETRTKPLKRKVYNKLCLKCKDSNVITLVKFTEEREDPEYEKRCEVCVNFGTDEDTDENSSFHFRHCAKGRVSRDGVEDGTKLVYVYDSCEEFES